MVITGTSLDKKFPKNSIFTYLCTLPPALVVEW